MARPRARRRGVPGETVLAATFTTNMLAVPVARAPASNVLRRTAPVFVRYVRTLRRRPVSRRRAHRPRATRDARNVSDDGMVGHVRVHAVRPSIAPVPYGCRAKRRKSSTAHRGRAAPNQCTSRDRRRARVGENTDCRTVLLRRIATRKNTKQIPTTYYQLQRFYANIRHSIFVIRCVRTCVCMGVRVRMRTASVCVARVFTIRALRRRGGGNTGFTLFTHRSRAAQISTVSI